MPFWGCLPLEGHGTDRTEGSGGGRWWLFAYSLLACYVLGCVVCCVQTFGVGEQAFTFGDNVCVRCMVLYTMTVLLSINLHLLTISYIYIYVFLYTLPCIYAIFYVSSVSSSLSALANELQNILLLPCLTMPKYMLSP